MLEIRNLTCGYGSDPVLKNISVTVRTGEFVTIIGPNGSGKTTFMRAVSRVIKPANGLITLDGRNVSDFSFKEFARMVAVAGNLRDTDLPMSVFEFVLLGRIPHLKGLSALENRTDFAHAHDAMALTGTLDLGKRSVNSLSSGERQIVFIARALAQEPRLLLLDEPTSYLDITHQARVMDLVKKLNSEQNLTIITILHDLNLASHYCDRILLFKDGTLTRDGSPGEVLTKEILEEVYRTPVVILENPATGRPYVCQLPSPQ
ncbi:MAG: ABC transporter ATP-binding protein [Syntrophobacterales bacterium]|jgi:iron complex transport system ATP-binding protein|nr:ABC transporter ATP-binding protein [Syntrophobacterales bacterium]